VDTGFWLEDLRKRDRLKEPGTFECGNEPLGSTKFGKFHQFYNFFSAHLPVIWLVFKS
jgi:hypothetical protein